jgi:hypothetical protein
MTIFLTLLFSTFGVGLLVKGSALYADQNASRHLKASKYILMGNILMTCTAFLAWDPRFAIPELLTVLTALRSYSAQAFLPFAAFSKKTPLSGLLVLLVLGVGAWVVFTYANSFLEALPSLGLMLLACAFALTPSGKTQKMYRTLTILGSGFLVFGSALTAKNATQAEALIMSLGFLALNGWFLLAEFWTVLRLKK